MKRPRTEGKPTTALSEENPLLRAVALVEARDAKRGPVAQCPPGQDAVSLLRELRETRSLHLAHLTEDATTSN